MQKKFKLNRLANQPVHRVSAGIYNGTYIPFVSDRKHKPVISLPCRQPAAQVKAGNGCASAKQQSLRRDQRPGKHPEEERRGRQVFLQLSVPACLHTAQKESQTSGYSSSHTSEKRSKLDMSSSESSSQSFQLLKSTLSQLSCTSTQEVI